MAYVRTKRDRRNKPPDRLIIILAAVFSILAITTAVVSFIWVRGLVASWTFTSLQGAPIDSGPSGAKQPVEVSKGTPVPVGPLQKPSDPTPVPWDGVSRITVLAMGLDYRDWESKEVPRTDTMILLTLDPVTKTAGMLTIPRDMWVTIPGFDHAKINTAYYLGEIYKLPGGGPGLAMQTVEQFIGVPINYYVVLDFNSFVKFIDEISGLKIDVPYDIVVDPVGPGQKITLYKGRQVLDGATILAYARNRYTDGGDFDRSERQMQVILAIRSRILDFNQLPTLITRAPVLYREIMSGVRTNLALDQIIGLARLGIQVNEKNIRRGVIGTEQITFGKSPEGLDILKPIPDKIRILRDDVFATGGPIAPAVVSGDPAVLMKTEKARVTLQNGTTTPRLVERTKEYLTGKGLTVLEGGNASQRVSATTIYDYRGKPYTMSFLVKEMNIRNDRILNRFDPNAQTDILIILGDDWAQKNPMK
jgi:LCP family protein required for cell wall assembly